MYCGCRYCVLPNSLILTRTKGTTSSPIRSIPHGGGWKDALTIRQGYELNYKLISLAVENHQGTLPPEHSFLQAQSDNVIVTALKKAEDEDALILRFYEWAGKTGDAVFQVPPGAQTASETDLMERPIGNVALNNSELRVATKPYEIKTVKIKFAKQPPPWAQQ